MHCLLMMMGGSGVRFGAEIPKQYIEIDGAPVFTYTLKKYSQCEFVDKIVIVSNPEWIEYTEKIAKELLGEKLFRVVAGGRTRSHSVKNGLKCCSNILKENDLVLIHDATNPFVDVNAISNGIEVASETGAAVIGTNQYHTIYSRECDDTIKNFIPRETVGSGYSPEIFKFNVIYPYYQNASEEQLEAMTSALALALECGVEAKFVPAELVNVKITYPHDMKAFIALMKYEIQEKEK